MGKTEKDDPKDLKMEATEGRAETREEPENQKGGEEDKPSVKSSNPVRKLTLFLLLIVVLLFGWYVAADRVAPWTDQARVQAWVIPLAPLVSGRITKIAAVEDELLQAGDLLATVDPEPYKINVQRAEAALEIAGQEIGAGTSAINQAQARVVEATVRVEEYEIRLARYEAVEAKTKGSVAKIQLDQLRADRDKAIAQLSSAEAELDRAKRQLGPDGENNPKIRDALAALRQARIDLSNTEIHAPTIGSITNQRITLGYYAQAGMPLMTFVSLTEVWVQANFRENSIANIQPGDLVEMALDTAPGRIFTGKVFSTGKAIQQPWEARIGEAHLVRSSTGWLRDAQRFPVLIVFDETVPEDLRRVGGQTDVQIYTKSSNGLLNGLGWFWIRLMSWVSYVY